ncbi:unnamed protein product [Sympodiomycopsis kandeliae]
MTSTPPPSAVANQIAAKQDKPTLAGTRIKQRKGVAKSQAKFEPEAFRDALLSHFDSVTSPTDWDGFTAALDKAGNTLDYRKYSDQLFDILIAGGILAPGGSYEDEEAPLSPFAVFAAPSAKVDDVKPYISVIDKVIRRYKFLQKPLEETTLVGILQYINRFSPEQSQKLATATALFMQSGLVNANVLQVIQKDHLVKDDRAITFVDDVFRAYLVEGSIDTLGSALRKGGIRDPLLFFPQQKRSQPGVVTNHFKSSGLPTVADYWARRAAKDARDGVISRLGEMSQDESSSNEDILEFLQEQRARTGLSMDDFVPIVFDGLTKSIQWSTRSDQIEGQALKEFKDFSSILEPFCTSPKSEIALINKVQLLCYEDQRILKTFTNILKILYNNDVLSDQAIIYWATKGARAEGKETFLNQASPLVKYLQEQSDDEDED